MIALLRYEEALLTENSGGRTRNLDLDHRNYNCDLSHTMKF